MVTRNTETPTGVAPNADPQHVQDKRASMGKGIVIILACLGAIALAFYVAVPIYAYFASS